MTLEIQLLGSPRFNQGGQRFKLNRRKSIALLAYLVVTRRPYPREALAALCWPEYDQSTARTNLRRNLSWLRQKLPQELLLIDRLQVEYNEAADVSVDVHQFEERLATVENHDHPSGILCDACGQLLVEAVDLYQGEFMAGFSLSDTAEFDEWLFFQREQRRQATAVALQQLVGWYRSQGQYEQGIGYGRRWLTLDPWHEPAHRALMELYAWADQQAAALRQYEECVRLLNEELGIEPEPETTALFAAIKSRRFEKAPAIKPKTEKNKHKEPDLSSPVHRPRFLDKDILPEPPPVFVARERELAQLAAALDSAQAGQGQSIFVIGGAGRGKSILIQEFARRAQVADPDLIVVSGYCDAMTGVGDPYLPFRGALTMLTGEVEAKWAGGLISQAHARRLWESMSFTLPALVEHAPDLIGSFLPVTALQARATAVATPETAWFKQLIHIATAEHESGLEQQRIFSQYTALLKAVAAQRPLLFIIEDLHWVDTASSGLLFHLSREIGDGRILMIGTYRPEEVSQSWNDEQHSLASIVSELKRQHGDIWLDLGDLSAIDGRQFVEAYLDTQPNKLDNTFREALFQHTGGYALFTVELLQDMQERGDLILDSDGDLITADAIDWQTLPVKVEGVIEKRIQHLQKEWQEVLAIASVEGEIFTAEVVARIQELDARKLVRQLSHELDKEHRLISAQTLARVGQQRLSRYRFRHNLFQHYLYHNLDEVERGYLHEAVGNILEAMYENRTDEVAVQLAWHFQEAGLVAKAAHYLQKAGDVASRVYAHTEAIAAYRQALTLIAQHQIDYPDLIDLYSRLGRTLELNSQFEEALANYEEMARVARQQNNRPLELAALMPQVTLYVTPTPLHDPIKGPASGQEALKLARELGDQAAEAKTLWNLALGGMWSGHTTEGIVYGEQAAALARQLNLTELLAYALNDLGMLYLTVLHLGQAKQALGEARRLWRELDNLPMLTDGLGMGSAAHVLAGEFDQAVILSDEAFQISTASNNLWGQSFSQMIVSWAYWELGRPDQAVMKANESVRLGKLAGFIASQVLAGGYQAIIYGNLGAVAQGIEMARQAVAVAEAQFPHFRCHPLGVLAQLHLLAGELAEAESVVAQGKKDPYAAAHPAWNMRINIAEVELTLAQGDYQQTIAVVDHWLPKLRQNSMQTFIATFLHLKSQALLALDKANDAREGWLEARDIALAINAQTLLWPILFALSQLETDPAEAQRLCQQAREIVDTIANHIDDPDLQATYRNLPSVRTLFSTT